MNLKLSLVVLCSMFFFHAYSQKIASRKFHRFRVVPHKKYEQKIDSSTISTDVFYSNTNNWTGENYGFQPSLQFMVTYDNNKNFSAGIFGCANYSGLKGGFPDGLDLFISRKMGNKFTLIMDSYLYLNRKDSLESYLGYKAKIYTQYTSRLKYDFNKDFDLILGYSIFNNMYTLQQSVSIELDYNISEELIIALVYSTGSRILNFKDGGFSNGIGFLTDVKNGFKVGLTFNPLFNETAPAVYSPLLFVLSKTW